LKQVIICSSTIRAFVEQSFCLENCSIYWKWLDSQRLIGLYNLKMKFKVCFDACTFKQLESQVVALKKNTWNNLLTTVEKLHLNHTIDTWNNLLTTVCICGGISHMVLSVNANCIENQLNAC
jgi:hypothetical protein